MTDDWVFLPLYPQLFCYISTVGIAQIHVLWFSDIPLVQKFIGIPLITKV